MINEDNEVRKRESKGGVIYDLVLEQPSSDIPAKALQSPARHVSVEEIENKLKAAEERRLKMESEKVSALKEKEAHILEMRDKKNECDEIFKVSTRESLDKKMASFNENRENIIRSIQDKQREHVTLVEKIRKQSLGFDSNKEELLLQYNKKMESATEARESQIADLRKRLQEREEHAAEVRALKEAQTSSPQSRELREKLDAKLKKAEENRNVIFKELQDKLQEHERRISEVRQNKELNASANIAGDSLPE